MLPKPDDGPDWVHVTGYWQSPVTSNYDPTADLLKFLDAGDPPVCVGFGSMKFGDPTSMTRLVVEALRKAGLRGVLLSGWDGMEGEETSDSIYFAREIPHDWLFSKVRVSVNAGGIGTLTRACESGIPSVVVPFGGDNVFWAWQMKRLGIGPEPIPVKALTADALAERLMEVCAEDGKRFREAAAKLSQRMRIEDGLEQARRLIEGEVLRHG